MPKLLTILKSTDHRLPITDHRFKRLDPALVHCIKIDGARLVECNDWLELVFQRAGKYGPALLIKEIGKFLLGVGKGE